MNGIGSHEPRKRAPQRVEAYVHLFRDKIKPIVDNILQVVPEKEWLNMRRRTVSNMLYKEPQAVQEAVDDYITRWRVDQKREKSKGPMEKPSTTPAEYHACVIYSITLWITL